jgi:hypothetical protein
VDSHSHATQGFGKTLDERVLARVATQPARISELLVRAAEELDQVGVLLEYLRVELPHAGYYTAADLASAPDGVYYTARDLRVALERLVADVVAVRAQLTKRPAAQILAETPRAELPDPRSAGNVIGWVPAMPSLGVAGVVRGATELLEGHTREADHELAKTVSQTVHELAEATLLYEQLEARRDSTSAVDGSGLADSPPGHGKSRSLADRRPWRARSGSRSPKHSE